MTTYKTRQQNLLLSYLNGTEGTHFTVEDILSHFQSKNITLGKATVYRQLEKLINEGIVVKYFIDEQSAACFEYTGCKNNPQKIPIQHIHIKCYECGKLMHLECEEIQKLGLHLFDKHKIKLDLARTVLYGLCPECSAKEKL